MNNRTIHYEQKDQDWWLCNNDCHQIVQVMIKIAQNTSLLQIDALEWHPELKRKVTEKEIDKTGESNNANGYRVNQDDRNVNHEERSEKLNEHKLSKEWTVPTHSTRKGTKKLIMTRIK